MYQIGDTVTVDNGKFGWTVTGLWADGCEITREGFVRLVHHRAMRPVTLSERRPSLLDRIIKRLARARR
jgi:hypothetical protein